MLGNLESSVTGNEVLVDVVTRKLGEDVRIDRQRTG